MFIKIQTAESKTKHLEQKIEDLIERHRNDQEFWMKEKGELLRRLGSMRNVHNRDTRRTEDILTGVRVYYSYVLMWDREIPSEDQNNS